MVIGAFPIAKLSVLLIKQISKPIANVCKERAKNHPFFRTYVCMPPAQFYNWCEVKAKMWVLNLGRPVNIPVLSQEMAIELGANLLGESVIFIIGAGLLIIEYNRQSKKETAKEEARENELKHISSTITDLYFTVQQQETQIRELERILHSVSGKWTDVPSSRVKDLDKSVKDLEDIAKGKTPPKPPAATQSTEKKPSSQQPIEEKAKEVSKMSTPYPDQGLILQSLNFIQMDVFSSIFSNGKREEEKNQKDDKSQVIKKRDNAVLTDALHNIEYNFRSLF